MRLSRDPAARRRLAALIAVGALALVIGLVVGAGGDEDGGSGAATTPTPQEKATKEARGLPLEEAVGQTLVSSFDGPELPAYLRRRLGAGQTAGVILFGRNIPSAEGLRSLTLSIQRSAGGGALVAVDQEGGEIRNVPFAGPVAGQSSQGDPAAVEQAARDGGRSLRKLGVNVNLAPVADVAEGSALAGRTFPGGPAEVADRVGAAVRGYAGARVAATAKHFPGLGAADVNTDDGPVEISDTRAEIERRDLPPFRAAIDEGVPLVMSSHALYPALDGERIASQSPALLNDLLRDEMRFRGAVVTDSIEADAVLSRSGVGAAAERSILGGSDLVLMTGSASWKLAYPRLLRRARRDPALRARVQEAAGRVLALKRSLGLPAR